MSHIFNAASCLAPACGRFFDGAAVVMKGDFQMKKQGIEMTLSHQSGANTKLLIQKS